MSVEVAERIVNVPVPGLVGPGQCKIRSVQVIFESFGRSCFILSRAEFFLFIVFIV